MEGINLIHGDSLQALKEYKDNHFDVAIVDPPYGVINDNKATGFKNDTFKNTRNAAEWDFKPKKEYWKELFRVSKEQIIWGFQYFIDELPPTKSIIIWDKMNGANFMNDAELAWNSGKGNNKIFKHAYIGRYHPEPNKIHPTQKPTKLYEFLLDEYTKENDLILDTHLGSGSIAIACHYMKRNLIGYEIDKDYYDAACKRFKEQTSQQALW